MHQRFFTLAAIVVGVFLAAPLMGQEGDEAELRVSELVVCTDIVDLEPVGVDSVFESSIDMLYCFSRITGAASETTIRHRWLFNNEVMADVELNVGSASWRTYSSKKLTPEWQGTWQVEVVDMDDNVLGRITFLIEE